MWFKDPTINRKTEISLIFVNYQISSFLPIDQLDLDVEERRAGPAGGSIVRPIKVKVLKRHFRNIQNVIERITLPRS